MRKSFKIVVVGLALLTMVALVSSGNAGVSVAAPLTPQSIPGKVPIEVLAGHGTEVYRLSAPAEFRAQRSATATFIINYVAAGSTNALGDLRLGITAVVKLADAQIRRDMALVFRKELPQAENMSPRVPRRRISAASRHSG